jgi:CspA family cold shock protein
MRGTVKWFDAKRGYGFITPDYGRDDVFVHHTNIVTEQFKALGNGQRVDFDVEVGDRGVYATYVKEVDASLIAA